MKNSISIFCFSLALTSVAASPSLAAPKAPPAVGAKQVDRMWVVGAPVLGDKSPEGLYVWIENGGWRLAVVRQSDRAPVQFKVRSNRPMRLSGNKSFRVESHRGGVMTVSVRGKRKITKGTLGSQGDLTWSQIQKAKRNFPLYFGPLAKRGARKLSIGRY